MPPKVKPAASVYVVTHSDGIESVHASKESANVRVFQAKEEGFTSVNVETHTLISDTIQISGKKLKAAAKPKAEPKAKAEPKHKATKSEETKPAPKANTPAAKKTKTPGEQHDEHEKKPGKAVDADLPGNMKLLLNGSGSALKGMRVVITGAPSTLGRKNAEKLVQSYGGVLTSSLSKNTNFVLVGKKAGPSKLKKVEELSIQTVFEDEFVEMLEKGAGAIDEDGSGDGEESEQERQEEQEEQEEVETPPKKKARKQE